MLMIRFLLIVILAFAFVAVCDGQTITNSALKKAVSNQANSPIKSSPAYAEILLRKTERESELEEFLLAYTEEFPKVKEIRFELSLIQKEMDKILAVNVSESGKLTLALGKLMVRKIEIETDLWNLRRQYSNDHPEVKRVKRKFEVFDKAIKEIL